MRFLVDAQLPPAIASSRCGDETGRAPDGNNLGDGSKSTLQLSGRTFSSQIES